MADPADVLGGAGPGAAADLGAVMPEAVYCILLAMVEYEAATTAELSAASGYTVDKYTRVLTKAMAMGWAVKPWLGRWQITERGKIAVAVEMGRRTKAIRSGRRLRLPPLVKFLRIEHA